MMMKRSGPGFSYLLGIAIATLPASLLTGCGLTSAAPEKINPALPASAAFVGRAHGGQQPISGAVIQVFAAGNTGYGSAYPYTSGSSLLGSTSVVTDSNGYFAIPAGTYTCPSSSTLIYITATGGNPGIAGSSNNPSPINPNQVTASVIGACGSVTNSTYISMNELTTVAFAWALAPFISGTSVGAPTTNTQGLVNAFQTAANLINPGTGQAGGPGLAPGAVLPLSKMYTLADILSSCVNTQGGSAGDGSSCGTLFDKARANGTAPTDVLTAAVNIARNPQQNVAALYNLSPPASPFNPTLTSAPNDFNLVVNYTAGSLSTPRALAPDPYGNIWVANSGGGSVTELNPSGAAVGTATAIATGSAPSAIAVDQNGNAWVANTGASTVTSISPSGASTKTYAVGSAPSAIAVDAFGNVFTANSGNASISEINVGTGVGTVVTTAVGTTSGPAAMAVNPK